MEKKRIVLGISGASGAPLAVTCLKLLQTMPEYETHLVITKGGVETLLMETDMALEEVRDLADICYDNQNIGAAIASGTFQTEAMIVVPCSMKTAAGIYSGYSDNLLLRAADVTIKERRRLVLVAREAPFSQIHLRNLEYLSGIQNVVVLPPVVSYYSKPETLEDVNLHIAGKILDEAGVDVDRLPPRFGFKRWKGEI